MKIFGTIAVVLLLSVGMFGQGLPVGNCPPGSSSCPTAQLPINHAPSAVPSALRSLAATATSADSCNPGAHIWCVGISGTGSNAQANEALLFTAWQNAGAAIAAGSTGEVVVINAGFQYNGQTATLHGPFNMPNGGCIGNGLPPNSDPQCSILVSTFTQPNPSSPAYIYTVSTHYNHAPAVGVRVTPYNGTGYSTPTNQVANVCTGVGIPNASCTGSDFAKINASSANWGILFPDHLNGMAFEMVEFGSVSTVGEGFPLTELGYSAGLVYAAGAGAAGARAIVINNAGVKDWLHSAIIVDVGSPLIVKAYTTTGSCTGSGPDVVLPSGVATIVCFVGANTNWVNGQSFIRVTWQGRDWPAQDITVNSTNCGSGFSTSPNLCVVDHTHAFVSITGTATSPTNGGMHDYYIDTPPTGFTGSSAAGTEHSVTNEALIVTEGNPAPTWTMTCATCPAGGPTGGFAVPADGVARAVTANGTPAGGGQTNWTSDHVLSFGGTAVTAAGFSTTTTGPVSPGTNVNIPVVSSTNFGASVTATIDTGSNLETFTITSVSTGIIVGTLTKSHASGVTVSIPQWVDVAGQVLHATVTATSSGSIPVAPRSITIRGTLRAPLVTPVQELDVHYKGLSMLSSATHGIDFCSLFGSRQISNFVERNGTYTLTCFGIGTTWATLPPCTSACGTAEVNFGSDIIINSITPISNTQLQVNFTLGANTEEGSKNLIFEHVWAHGVDGNILNSSTNAPCTTTGQDCYQTGAQGLIAGIRGDAAGFSFIDGYLDSVHAANVAQDTPGFYASLGTGPLLLQNSFFEAATENVFTGGAGSMDINSATEPCDVEITGNYLYKPPYWHNGGISVISTNACVSGSGCGCVTTTGHYKCVMSVKDNEEHKSGCRIHSWNNVMDGNWTGVNVSYWTVSVTPRDAVGQGTISSGTLDLNIGPNIIVNILNGINATSYDVNCVYGVDDNCVHGVMATTVNHRNVFQQDLFIANQNENSFGNNGHPPRMWNVGTMLQNFLLFHDTFMLASDIAETATNGTYYNLAPAEPSPCGTIDQPSNNLWALNNVWYNGFGGDSGCTPMAQSGQAGWASAPAASPNAFVNRFIGNVFNTPTTGIWSPYPTNGVGFAPTVVSSITSMNAIVANAFNGNYELNGTLPGLTNWITPPNSPETTDQTTSGIDNPTVTSFVTAAITGGTALTLTVTTTSLANGTQAQLYSALTNAVGGTPPYTWCIIENSTCDNGTGGALPPGLSLATVGNQGQITGTPTTGGNYPFTVQVTDAASNVATAPLAINILGITTLTLPSGTVLVPYSALLGAAGGTPPYAWTIVAGTICSGLGLSIGGAITGTPGTVGTCGFTVRATDSSTPSRFVNAPESITINNAPILAPTGMTGAAGISGGRIH